jgi:hypothetical protein
MVSVEGKGVNWETGMDGGSVGGMFPARRRSLKNEKRTLPNENAFERLDPQAGERDGASLEFASGFHSAESAIRVLS